jgi:hypothetical protein
MAELLSVTLLKAVGGTTISPSTPRNDYLSSTVEIQASGSNTASVTIEGSFDGINWYALPYRTPSSDTSTNAAIVVSAGANAIFFLDPKWVALVRLNVTANTGAILSAYLRSVP